MTTSTLTKPQVATLNAIANKDASFKLDMRVVNRLLKDELLGRDGDSYYVTAKGPEEDNKAAAAAAFPRAAKELAAKAEDKVRHTAPEAQRRTVLGSVPKHTVGKIREDAVDAFCKCGCGETVKLKSHFRQGHDARVKGMLLRDFGMTREQIAQKPVAVWAVEKGIAK